MKMPNWCMNVVKLEGERAEEILKDLISTEDNVMYFDLNKIVEMPEELNCDRDSYSSQGLKMILTEKYPYSTYAGERKDKLNVLEFSNYLLKLFKNDVALGKEKFIMNEDEYMKYKNSKDYEKYKKGGLLALSNLEKYGYKDWYDWRLEHWGTKWNTSETILLENECAVIFDTAWDPPVPAIEALSQKYPNLEIELIFAEEQIGYYTGDLVFKNGRCVSCNQPKPYSKEAYEIAFSIWGDFDDSYIFDEKKNTYVSKYELEMEE